MKKLQFIFSICMFLFASCIQEQSVELAQTPKPLTLSIADSTYNVTEAKMYYHIKTDAIDTQFSILTGNGNYVVSGLDGCKATINQEGQVNVNILESHASLSISDAEGLTRSVMIDSSNDMFYSYSHQIGIHTLLAEGVKESLFDPFGVGPYRIEHLSGNTASVELTGECTLRVTPLKGGTSHFNLLDKRGMVVPLYINVSTEVALDDSHSLALSLSAEETIYVKVAKKMNWEVVSTTQQSFFEHVVMHRVGADKDADYLQISIVADVNPQYNSGIIHLLNKDGVAAIIEVVGK